VIIVIPLDHTYTGHCPFVELYNCKLYDSSGVFCTPFSRRLATLVLTYISVLFKKEWGKNLEYF
jgi:hypothetical protein